MELILLTRVGRWASPLLSSATGPMSSLTASGVVGVCRMSMWEARGRSRRIHLITLELASSSSYFADPMSASRKANVLLPVAREGYAVSGFNKFSHFRQKGVSVCPSRASLLPLAVHAWCMLGACPPGACPPARLAGWLSARLCTSDAFLRVGPPREWRLPAQQPSEPPVQGQG